MFCFLAAQTKKQTGKHLLRTQNVSEKIQKHFLRIGRKCYVRAQTGKHLRPQQYFLVCGAFRSGKRRDPRNEVGSEPDRPETISNQTGEITVRFDPYQSHPLQDKHAILLCHNEGARVQKNTFDQLNDILRSGGAIFFQRKNRKEAGCGHGRHTS